MLSLCRPLLASLLLLGRVGVAPQGRVGSTIGGIPVVGDGAPSSLPLRASIAAPGCAAVPGLLSAPLRRL